MIELDVMKAIKERRSIRTYINKSISDEDAIKILNAGRWAPSGGNRQPLYT
jgi:nitroreductase